MMFAFFHGSPIAICVIWTLTCALSAGSQNTEPIFAEKAFECGIDFHHFNGMTGAFYVPEEVGPGVALFDFDGDGDLDVYLVQGNALGGDHHLGKALFPPRHPVPLSDRLYRNDGTVGGALKFSDVTVRSGLKAEGYGMGVAIADMDNDGDADIYVTNWGANQLWRNNGDGSFQDVTERAGVGDGRWSTSATFLDFDGDGLQDLFVANYIRYSHQNHKRCHTTDGRREYCGPSAYPDAPDRLYHNLGDGRFEDVTRAAGLASEFGSGLGVLAGDFNGDNFVDIYVANDADANLLWLNSGKGTFTNDALLAGCALNANGAAEAGMGVSAGDVDGDGDEDIFLTHITGETHTLYINQGTGLFEDRTTAYNLATTSLEATGFGTTFIDYDNDSHLDLLAANGTVMTIARLRQAGDPHPLHQPNQLFRNHEGKRFVEVSALAGEGFLHSEVSRGTALGDIDNDGDHDVLITNNNGPARLLLNRVGNHNPWLGVHLVDAAGHTLTGARVCLERKHAPAIWRTARRDGSYLSASDPRLLFGLGKHAKVLQITVFWPSGSKESWPGPEANQYVTLKLGSGKKQP